MKHNEDIIKFCENIRRLRERNKFSLDKMAEDLEISVEELEAIENYRLPETVTVDLVFAIYDKFGILPSDQFR